MNLATKMVTILSPSGASYASKVLGTQSASLIAYWPLSETSGTTADNAEGTAARDGTFARNVTTMGTGAGPAGGTAPLFTPGSSDLCDIYSASLATAFDGTGETEGTLACWIKVRAASVWTDLTARTIVNLEANGTNYIRIWKGSSNDTINFTYKAGGTTKTVQGTLSATGWTHLAMTWSASGDALKGYVNGSQVGSTLTGLGAWGGAADLVSATTLIGADNTTPTNVWDGYIAHVPIWKTPLSDAEITALAAA